MRFVLNNTIICFVSTFLLTQIAFAEVLPDEEVLYRCPETNIGGSTNIQERMSCHPDSDICCNPVWHGKDRHFAGFDCYMNSNKLELTSGQMDCSRERINRIFNVMWSENRICTNSANTPKMVQEAFNRGLDQAEKELFLKCGDSSCVPYN